MKLLNNHLRPITKIVTYYTLAQLASTVTVDRHRKIRYLRKDILTCRSGRLDGLPGHIPNPVMGSQRSANAAVADRLT